MHKCRGNSPEEWRRRCSGVQIRFPVSTGVEVAEDDRWDADGIVDGDDCGSVRTGSGADGAREDRDEEGDEGDEDSEGVRGRRAMPEGPFLQREGSSFSILGCYEIS